MTDLSRLEASRPHRCVGYGTRLLFRIPEVERFLLRLHSEQVPAHHGRVEGNASNYCPADPGGAVGVSRAGQEVGQSDTMVKPRELPGYLKTVRVRPDRFDALACDNACGTLRAGGRTAMAAMAIARDPQPVGGRVVGTPEPGSGTALGSGGMAAPGQFGERLMRDRPVNAC